VILHDRLNQLSMIMRQNLYSMAESPGVIASAAKKSLPAS